MSRRVGQRCRVFLFVGVLLGVGCAQHDAALVGTWTHLDADTPKELADAAYELAQADAEVRERFVESARAARRQDAELTVPYLEDMFSGIMLSLDPLDGRGREDLTLLGDGRFTRVRYEPGDTPVESGAGAWRSVNGRLELRYDERVTDGPGGVIVETRVTRTSAYAVDVDELRLYTYTSQLFGGKGGVVEQVWTRE